MRFLTLFSSVLWLTLNAGCADHEWPTRDTGAAGGDGDVELDGFGEEGGDADVDADSDSDSDSDSDTDADVAEDADPEETELPWVEILAPRDGEVLNPVTFELATGGGVVSLTLEADDWPLHSVPLSADAGSHVYDFSGVDYERHVVLTGFDGSDRTVATDEVWITPVNPIPDLVFPISLDETTLFLSNFDSSSSTGSFGASRSGGRLHAGCDLYWTDDDGNYYVDSYYRFNDNRAVYAVADGTITAYYPFYLGTNAVEVDHGDFVIRYGEVDDRGLHGGLGVGSTVSAGQQLGTMGDLDIGSSWSMLHFELFSGELSGSLTQSGNRSYLHVPSGSYQRRGDLMDCTPFLLEILEESGF